MATKRISAEEAGEIFNKHVKTYEASGRDVNKNREQILSTTIRDLLLKGVTDASYMKNLLGFTSQTQNYATTGLTCSKFFDKCYFRVIAYVRKCLFDKSIKEVFNVTLDGIRGQSSRNAKFALAAEQDLDKIPEIITTNKSGTFVYSPTPIQWIADNIAENQATPEKWEKFKETYQTNLKKYTTLRTGRVDLESLFNSDGFAGF